MTRLVGEAQTLALWSGMLVHLKDGSRTKASRVAMFQLLKKDGWSGERTGMNRQGGGDVLAPA